MPEIELIVVREAERGGVTRRSLARAAAAGVLLPLRRGVYVHTEGWAALDPLQQHVLRIRALQASVQRPVVVSHWSAAALRALPVPLLQLGAVHVTVDEGGGRDIAGAHVRALALRPDEVEEIDGILCTSWSRTLLDVAATSAFADAVSLADASLHRVDPSLRAAATEHLRDEWARMPPRRASTRVPQVIDFADGDAESPGESMSRVTMRTLGLPRPVLQQVFRDGRGFAGKVDFWFPEERVIGEMDGKSKYLDVRLNRGDPAAVVYDEKRREDRLRAMSSGFVRWSWAEACSPRLLGAKLAAVGVRPR